MDSYFHPKLLNIYRMLKGSFWLLPLCMLIAALLIAPAVVELDLLLASRPEIDVLANVRLSVDGARMILSTITGSMITVASLVFSLTLIALSLVAQQLGPRILQIFMEDRPTQIVLGLFIATFLFAMVVLGAVGFDKADTFVPKIGVFISGGLAVIAFVAVILFVHHIARQMQADVVIYQTAQKLFSAIEEIADENNGENADHIDSKEFDRLRSAFDKNGREILLDRASGYVQYIDAACALNLANEHGLEIAFSCRPGQFVLKGRPLMQLIPTSRVGQDLESELGQVIQLGSQRTRGQRVEFELLALVEIALRALSKGINDPFTAMNAIAWLSAGLARLLEHHPNYRVHRGEQGTIRVLECPQTFDGYLRSAFDPIRDAAMDIPIVLSRLGTALSDLKTLATDDVQMRALDEQLEKLDKMQINRSV